VQATDAAQAVEKARARAADLVIAGGAAEDVARVVEELTAGDAMSGAASVAWRADATGSEVARLTALGVVVALASAESLRRACIEALERRETQATQGDARGARGEGSAPGSDASRADADVEAVELSGKRVVVADDDPAIAWFFADVLRLAGCEVDEAGDGAAALDAARRRVPDVVFSDVRMPRLNGVRLCKALRADPVLADVPVVLLSWQKDWLPQACRDARAAGSLIKHATPEEVLACVRAALAPHVAFERRLRKAGAVRGSLEGISPYRVLRGVCETRRDARVTFHDAAHTWEIRVRDGAPRAAMRVVAEGKVARGEEALVSSLAARAGRFAVVPEGSPVERELRGTFYEQIASHVAGARGFAVARPLEQDPTIPMSLGSDDASETATPGSFELPRPSATLVELPVRTVPMARRPLAAQRESTLRLVFPTVRLPRRAADSRAASSKRTRAQGAPANKRTSAPAAVASRKPTTRWAVLGTVLLVVLALGQSGGTPPTPASAARLAQTTGTSAGRAMDSGADASGATASPPSQTVRASRANPERPR
jgi:two-component system phosphate regulon response regulator PhoB